MNEINEIIQLGNICAKDISITEGGFGINPQPGRVYSVTGIAPTLNTMQGGHRVPYLVINEDENE